MHIKRTLLLLSVGCALLSAPAGAQQAVRLDSLMLRSGDLIKVEVWREEDLSGEFVVDPAGRVVLPLLGSVEVTTRPWARTKDDLLAAYRVELRNPSVELTPLRRVYVLGEVNEPGPYEIDPAMSLAGAVAMAGGAGPQGDIRKVKIVRDGAVILDGVAVESALAGVDVRSGDQIFVDQRSWFERNSTFLVSALLSVTTIVVTLAVR